MNRSTRMIALTSLLITLIAGASFARPSWPTDLGVDFWSVPALQAKLKEEGRWHDQLEALDAAVKQRIAVKDLIIADVLAHRTSLIEAAAEFRRLNADEPKYMDVLRESFPSRSDEECLCRNVLAYVSMSGRRQPERIKAEVARLEAELREATDADGRVSLPD
jgi:hypothetical protein